MQIIQSSGYLPPSDQEIKAAANESGVDIDVPDFVRDVCSLRAGGSIKTMEQMDATMELELKKKPILTVKDPRGSNAHRVIFKRQDISHNSYNKHSDAKAAFLHDHLQLASTIQYALNTVNRQSDVLGDTPMYQALNLIKLLQQQAGNGGGSGEGKSENEIIQKLLDKNNIDKANQTIQEAKAMNKSEREMLDTIAKLKKKGAPSDQSSAGGGTGISDPDTDEEGAGGPHNEIMQAALNLTDKQLAEAIKVSRKLQSISKLKTSKITKFIPDSQESEVQNRAMKNFDEFGKLKPSQFASMPITPGLFRYKAATNQLLIRERGKYSEKKQLLYVVVDSSGSMREESGRRIAMAAGVLINRLMAVAKGDAALYWRFFDDKCYPCSYVEHKDQAYSTITDILNTQNFSGGGTNFDMAIKSAVEHIETLQETMNLGRPEIFMVTDGACHCYTKFKDLKGIKLHTAYVSDDTCYELSDLSKQSGGVVLDLAAS
jgi:uncharacterized protein with von Willebrand factor type A (vWA) domain